MSTYYLQCVSEVIIISQINKLLNFIVDNTSILYKSLNLVIFEPFHNFIKLNLGFYDIYKLQREMYRYQYTMITLKRFTMSKNLDFFL